MFSKPVLLESVTLASVTSSFNEPFWTFSLVAIVPPFTLVDVVCTSLPILANTGSSLNPPSLNVRFSLVKAIL